MNDLVNQFYTDYIMLKDTLARSINFTDALTEEDTKPIREEYATLLLNRLIFMFFLQTPRGARPSIIPEQYLQALQERSGATFHETLRMVWFDHLGASGPRQDTGSQFDDIPCLNCSLFSPHEGLEKAADDQLRGIQVDDDALGNALAMLEQYSWTLDETEPSTAMDCITPSILGHIYEKACNQKESGSYYTPDYITTYIIKKSLSLFLTSQLNVAFSTSYGDVFTDLLERESLSGNDEEHIAWLYFAIIRKLTLCDNACGSGAFLIAAARILEDIHKACLTRIPSSHPGFQGRVKQTANMEAMDEIKQYIILNNIFGVDIQLGSIEIAKLRLWLYLLATIDARQENVLPDLDANLRVGNSLLGFIDITDAWKNRLSLNADAIKQQFERLKGFLRGLQCNLSRSGVVKTKQTMHDVKKILQDDLDRAYLASAGVSSMQKASDLQLFHWCIEFPDIISRGGFDIIIGNPPYLSFSSSKAKKEIIGKDITRKIYKDADDVYEAFIKRTRELCHGISGVIIPYNFYKQLGPCMIKNVVEYDNLGEGIFIGVSIAVAILFFDKNQHDDFNFRNYVFQENKRSLLGAISPSRLSSFDLYKDDPIITFIESVARSHESYGLEVTRGEEMGKKALHVTREPGFIPIYTANELFPFRLEPATYFIDPGILKKNFYDTQKIGVNLAFRHRIKAGFVANVVTIKSIISIYNAPVRVLLEVLGSWNSKLFDWYQCKKYSNFQEIRLNRIDDIKARYPLLLIDRLEFQEIVKYLVMSYSTYVHELVDFIIYEIFFIDKLVSDGIYTSPSFHLIDAIGKYILPVDFDGWSVLHWKTMAGMDLTMQEENDLMAIDAKNKDIMETAIHAMQASEEVRHWMETMKSHPWITRIEKEPAH